MCVGRCCTIFAAIWTICQTATQFALAVTGLMLYNCQIHGESSMNLIEYPYGFMHLAYFWNPSCRDSNILTIKLADSTQDWLNIKFFGDQVPVAYRTSQFLLAYVILNIVLLVFSLLLLCTLCMNAGKTRLYFQIPWIVVAGALLILDIVASIYYAIDITTIDSLHAMFVDILNIETINNCPIEFVFHDSNRCIDYIDTGGIEIPTDVTELPFPNLSHLEELFPPLFLQIPSILMTSFFCRFILFWVFNLCFFIGVINSARQTSKHKGHVHERPGPAPFNANWNRNHQNQGYNNQGYFEEPYRAPINAYDNRNLNPPLNSYPYENRQPPYNPNAHNFDAPEYSYPVKSPTSPPAYSTLNGDDRGGNRFAPLKSNLKKTAPLAPPPETSISAPYKEPPKKNILPTAPKPKMPPPINGPRPVNSSLPFGQQINNPRDSNLSAAQNPAELRSQMPWSYFQSRENQPVTAPRRNFTELRDDEELPPVPVPDYTLHFPKRNRGSPSPGSTDSFRSQEILY